jgi:hypothetical protein
MKRSFFLKLTVSAVAVIVASSTELFEMRKAANEFLRHRKRIIYILDEWQEVHPNITFEKGNRLVFRLTHPLQTI